jgi:hypothetical protein
MNAMTSKTDELARLRMDARYHGERRDLYRAKAYGPHATSPERLRELERTAERATERLKFAEAEAKEAAEARDRG